MKLYDISLSGEDVVLFGQAMDEMKRRLNAMTADIQAQITAQDKPIEAENIINFASGPSPALNLAAEG